MNACEISRSALVASDSCCASFGELLQGELPDKRRFLVTLPIELHAHARYSVSGRAPGLRAQPESSLRVEPESSWKALRFVEALLTRHALPLIGELRLESEIPRGKGLSGSTADLVAAYRAVTSAYRLPRGMEELEALLREVEPSDGVMYPGVVAYLHREARLLARLGAVPRLTLVAVDEGGEVQTLAHNSRLQEYSAVERDEYADLLAQLRRALARGDIGALGAVATRSAQLNQRVQPKRFLDVMRDVAVATGAAGVVAAHSGTYLGILFDALSCDHDHWVSRAVSRLEALGLEPTRFETMSGQEMPDQAMSGRAVSDQAMSDQAVSDQAMSGRAVSDQAMSGQALQEIAHA